MDILENFFSLVVHLEDLFLGLLLVRMLSFVLSCLILIVLVLCTDLMFCCRRVCCFIFKYLYTENESFFIITMNISVSIDFNIKSRDLLIAWRKSLMNSLFSMGQFDTLRLISWEESVLRSILRKPMTMLIGISLVEFYDKKILVLNENMLVHGVGQWKAWGWEVIGRVISFSFSTHWYVLLISVYWEHRNLIGSS